MTTVSMKDAKNRFTELAHAAENGETITVTRHGQAVCAIVPLARRGGLDIRALRDFKRKRGIRKFFTYVAADFDKPLPEDFLLHPLPRPKKIRK